MTEVVAALIWHDSKFLICQRPAHKARGLLWELVGGKVEPGETKDQALIRECREEIGIVLSVGEPFADITHEYLDLTVHLSVFNATISEGEPQLLEHNALMWITPNEIVDYPFCPADEEILAKVSTINLVCVTMRSALENVAGKGCLPLRWSIFPAGACGWAAEALGIALSERYPQECCFRVHGKNGKKTHGWVEFSGLILDITADQFEEFSSRVVMIPKFSESFYLQYDTESRRVEGREYLQYKEEDLIYEEYVKLLDSNRF